MTRVVERRDGRRAAVRILQHLCVGSRRDKNVSHLVRAQALRGIGSVEGANVLPLPESVDVNFGYLRKWYGGDIDELPTGGCRVHPGPRKARWSAAEGHARQRCSAGCKQRGGGAEEKA